MKKYFHLYSFGARTPDLFTSQNDFVDAVNLIAVLSFQNGVSVIAYCIQDTHLHIILFGEPDACLRFRREMQRLLRRRHGFSFELEMAPVENPDYLKRVCSYVICQATKDGKRTMPYDYPWSSASLYFRTGIKDSLWRYDNGTHKEVIKMSGIGTRIQREMFHTRNRLPEEWEVCEGMIMPSSFVEIRKFEYIFQTHNAFRTFCGSGKNSDSIILDSMAEYHGINLEENEARSLAADKCREIFGFSDIRRLGTNQRIALARELRKGYHMSFSQIARRVYLPEIEVRKYLDAGKPVAGTLASATLLHTEKN